MHATCAVCCAEGEATRTCCCLARARRLLLQGAGGVITDWRGQPLTWRVDGGDVAAAVKAAPGEVLAAGDPAMHAAALQLLGWAQ